MVVGKFYKLILKFILKTYVILLLLPHKQMLIMLQSVLSLKNVNIYQEGKSILSQVNLDVKQGEFLYIIGKTGSGKSSLMKTLYGDLPLTEGEGHIVDFDLATLKEDEIPFLRRKIGIVFQDFKLLPDRTVKDNMLFVLKATSWIDNEEMQRKIDEVLDKVGMKEFGNKMQIGRAHV